jgi:enamine deaminase RidA (YjgF/YER057c/UK114 family)
MSDFAAVNEVWEAWLDPAHKPARVCVQATMAAPNILFEVGVRPSAHAHNIPSS